MVFLYSGWRISELLALKKTDVNLTEGTMTGGTKTKAGKGRVVPIHSKIRLFIEARIEEPGDYLFGHSGKHCSQSQYRIFWADFMTAWGMGHTPHECRHTFRTRLDSAGANQKCCDLLMGHVPKDTGNRVYNHKNIEELTATTEPIKK